MSDAGSETEQDAAEVEPIDNSSAAPVDLDRVEQVERKAKKSRAGSDRAIGVHRAGTFARTAIRRRPAISSGAAHDPECDARTLRPARIELRIRTPPRRVRMSTPRRRD
jgi:hypothetical protein